MTGEEELTALWAAAVGVPVDRIGRDDNFFAIGGTSRAAARLVLALGGRVSLADFARCPSLAHLADLLRASAAVPSGREG
jgi:phosphopantetheine binding protein